jgi:hypothetical protein
MSLVKKVEGAFGMTDLSSSQVQVLPNSMAVRSETDRFAKVAAASRVLDQLMRGSAATGEVPRVWDAFDPHS